MDKANQGNTNNSSSNNNYNSNVSNNESEKHVKIDSINLEDNQNNKSEIEYRSVNKNTSSGNISNNNRISLEMQNSEESVDRDLRTAADNFQVPSNLKKTFLCSLVLFIIGATLIGIGFIQDVAAADPGKGITFWTLGGIVMIPGGYYSYQFYKAKKTKDMQEREDILNEIPEL